MESKYLDFEKYLPYSDKPLVVKTPHGLRKAVSDSSRMGMIRATDCNDPHQNCNLSGYAFAWRYENEQDMNDLLFIPNHWAMQRAGEQILKTVNIRRSISERIIDFMKCIWKV